MLGPPRVCEGKISWFIDFSFLQSLDASVEDFDHVSGVYTMEVLIGDALVEPPIVWHVVSVTLKVVFSPQRNW